MLFLLSLFFFFCQTPSYSKLGVFGCACYPHLGAYITHKLLPRNIECVFLSYSLQHKEYKCIDHATSQVYISWHARSTSNTSTSSKWICVLVSPLALPLLVPKLAPTPLLPPSLLAILHVPPLFPAPLCTYHCR